MVFILNFKISIDNLEFGTLSIIDNKFHQLIATFLFNILNCYMFFGAF